MRQTCYILIALLGFIFISDKAFSATILVESEKIPVSIQHVVVCAEGIFLDVEGELCRIAGIVEGHDGYYAIPTPSAWYCPNCRHHNPYGTKKCYKCKEPRPPGHE